MLCGPAVSVDNDDTFPFSAGGTIAIDSGAGGAGAGITADTAPMMAITPMDTAPITSDTMPIGGDFISFGGDDVVMAPDDTIAAPASTVSTNATILVGTPHRTLLGCLPRPFTHVCAHRLTQLWLPWWLLDLTP